MRLRRLFSTLLVPGVALGHPTSSAGPRDPSGVSVSASSSSQTCRLYRFAETPINPPACWVWYAPTGQPADYCGPSTFSPVASSAASASWLDSCVSLRTAELAAPRDFFLAQYATDSFNTLIVSGGCALQVRPALPPSSDQVYVGGTDVTDVLKSAIAASRAAGDRNGIEGSMTCSPGLVNWRMVPI
ncbi:hypothetical protein GGS23DRAFT_235610 [Durotheca rogersii]|uniref:uncharacterized protein n=1 Tax=Durotheca rogersii TaxID=419775 RepID=UPI00221FFFA7|nr:uncharacterized protein GGS23DRAFT_235610 [Durotheca rogersii]KAI5860404.1 hypothetical protein GGS23DRAFT_235610 [Durotheca rogersii]